MAKSPVPLGGKVVSITGGGRGIGKATALAFARQGAIVAVGDLDADTAAATASEAGNGAIGIGVDITDHAAFSAFFTEVETQLGPIAVHINNAGIMPYGLFAEESPESTSRMIEVNLHAVIHGTREAILRMRPRGTGHVVNVASGAGWLPGPGVVTYCATKSAVVTFAEGLRLELGDTGIELSVIAPGIVSTELSLGLPALRGMRGVTPEEVADAIVGAVQYRRFAVFVPKSVGVAGLIYQALPYNVRRGLLKAARVDKINQRTDMNARSGYENRIAGAQPEHVTADVVK